MRLLIAAALVLPLLAGCEAKTADPTVAVEDAWVQLPVVPGRPGAAYFTLRSDHEPARLVGIASPRIGRVELHGSFTENGVTKMRKLEDTALRGGKLVFAPGGNHAMLFEIDPALKAGDKVPLTFSFEPAPDVIIEAEVRAFGEGHGGH